MRAPGMTLNRVPLFVWSMVVTAFMVIFAMPSVMMGSMFLAFERLIATHFFNYVEGGDVLLWQHLFWFFGHPEVYIIFIPALGMLSNLIIVFSRRKIIGHSALVLALIATAFISFGLWVHHMFAVGLPQLGLSYFTAASMIISIPTGVQIFCWVATLATGRLRWDTPLYYVFGFFAVFIIGGMTGVMTASVPFDWQIHDTFFIVAHLHYVLIGGSVFPILGIDSLLVAELDGPDAFRISRQACVLVRFRGFQSNVLSDAHPWASRDATTHVHVPAGDGLGSVEPARHR